MRVIFSSIISMMFLAMSPAVSAGSALQEGDLPGLLAGFDQAVASGEDAAIAEAVSDLSAAQDQFDTLLLPEEISDLHVAMALALARSQPEDAMLQMGLAIRVLEDLIEALEGADSQTPAPLTTLDIYAAREMLYARLIDAADLSKNLGDEPSTHRFTEQAEGIYAEYLQPGDITLQSMGAGAPPPPPSSGPHESGSDAAPREPFQVVRVFYGTNRAERSDDPNRAYSNERAALTYGTVEVSVPNNRAPGSIPRPRVGGEREGLHIVLRSINRMGSDGFDGLLRNSVAEARSGREEVFIFIHGHAVRFDEAARQTAQLAVDLDMREGAIMYSWPNGESVASYQISQAAVGVSSRRFANFLETVMDEVGDADIHIIAHSMGNRLVLNAIERLYDPEEGEPLFKHVFWASADIDVDLFQETLGEIEGVAEGMTAYTSGRDRALQLSSSLSGGYLRVGQSEPLPNVAEVITTVDTTSLSTGLTGHGDFSNSLIEDMQSVVWLSLPPEGRCILVPVELEGTSQFWRAVDDRPECAKDNFRRALWSVRQFGEEASERIRVAIDYDMVPEGDRDAWEEAFKISQDIER